MTKNGSKHTIWLWIVLMSTLRDLLELSLKAAPSTVSTLQKLETGNAHKSNKGCSLDWTAGPAGYCDFLEPSFPGITKTWEDNVRRYKLNSSCTASTRKFFSLAHWPEWAMVILAVTTLPLDLWRNCQRICSFNLSDRARCILFRHCAALGQQLDHRLDGARATDCDLTRIIHSKVSKCARCVLAN